MATSIPTEFPDWVSGEKTKSAYERGWSHGHGIACCNVPRLGEEYWTEAEGRMIADAENIRDVHQALCFAAEANSRQFTPFEFTAHEFNSDEEDGEELWEAFDAGIGDAIFADLAEYDDEDYGIEPEKSDADEEEDEE